MQLDAIDSVQPDAIDLDPEETEQVSVTVVSEKNRLLNKKCKYAILVSPHFCICIPPQSALQPDAIDSVQPDANDLDPEEAEQAAETMVSEKNLM